MDRYFAFGEGTPTALGRELHLLKVGPVSPIGEGTPAALGRELRSLFMGPLRNSVAVERCRIEIVKLCQIKKPETFI